MTIPNYMETEQLAQQQNNAAKFAFLYMLSLVSLAFTAISSGQVVFQIINKKFPDAVNPYLHQFDSGNLKFAIAAIIIAAPIYYFTAWQINKNLFSGGLAKEAAVRRWLTYFILFVASVTIIGWLIGVIFNYLDGELTAKFILKSATAIIIAAVVFSYYLYDIRREELAGKKDRVVRIYFYATAVLVSASLAAAFYYAPTPTETRNLRQDQDIISHFNQIDGAINGYLQQEKKLPANLEDLILDRRFLLESDIKDSVTGEKFEYHIVKDKEQYKLCATFLTDNRNSADSQYNYDNERWPHAAGRQCLIQRVYPLDAPIEKARPMSAPVPAPVTVPVR